MQTKEVRDLAWACFSAPLLFVENLAAKDSGIRDCALALTPERQAWLERLDSNPAMLLRYLTARPTHRLGVYFEQLWLFFLQQDPDVELVAHNLPVHDQGATLGEFDCIYFCPQRDRHVHLELAVKFFLGAPGLFKDTDSARAWLGPDTRDRLDLKTDHLINRQIRLSEHAAARQQLLDIGIEHPLKEVALKGYLFQPHDRALPMPPGFNRAHDLAQWVHYDALGSFLQTLPSDNFLIAPKMRWLSTVRTEDTRETLNPHDLEHQLSLYFKRDSYPLLVAALNKEGVESMRFFVTGSQWPLENASSVTG